jgi:hypothetical protein
MCSTSATKIKFGLKNFKQIRKTEMRSKNKPYRFLRNPEQQVQNQNQNQLL